MNAMQSLNETDLHLQKLRHNFP